MEHHLKKALVIGATGAVGRDLVDILLKDERYSSVTAFTRRDKLRNGVYTERYWHSTRKIDVLYRRLCPSGAVAGIHAGRRVVFCAGDIAEAGWL